MEDDKNCGEQGRQWLCTVVSMCWDFWLVFLREASMSVNCWIIIDIDQQELMEMGKMPILKKGENDCLSGNWKGRDFNVFVVKV